MEYKYKHLGYFNDQEDIDDMADMNAKDVVRYMLDGMGKFYEADESEDQLTFAEILDEYPGANKIGDTYVVTYETCNDEEDNFIDVWQAVDIPRINPAGEEEIIQICLSPDKTPIAYTARVKDLMDSGMDEEEAKKEALEPLEMEMYFQSGQGLFLVESEAVESTDIFSPYTKERYHSPLEDDPMTW